jgi:Trk K+ transport system NAD-binding subunit
MLQQKSRTLRVEEIALPGASSWAGKTLGELDLHERYDLLPLAVKYTGDSDSPLVVNPRGPTRLAAGSIIIVLGDSDNLIRARADASR